MKTGDFPHAAGARTLFPQRTGGLTPEATASVSPFPSVSPDKSALGEGMEATEAVDESRGGEYGPTWIQTIFRVPLFPQRTGGLTPEGTASVSPFPFISPDKARWGKGWGAWGEGEPPCALAKGVPLPPKTTPTTTNNHHNQQLPATITNTGRQGFGDAFFGSGGRQAAAGQ